MTFFKSTLKAFASVLVMFVGGLLMAVVKPILYIYRVTLSTQYAHDQVGFPLSPKLLPVVASVPAQSAELESLLPKFTSDHPVQDLESENSQEFKPCKFIVTAADVRSKSASNRILESIIYRFKNISRQG